MIDETHFIIFAAFLRKQSHPLGWILVSAVLLTATLLARRDVGNKQKLSLPVVGKSTDGDFRAALEEGQRLYPEKAFALPSQPPIVILPHRLINRLKSAPESQLSADKEVCRRGLGQYTDLGTPMPEMFNAIKVDLTRHVRDLVPVLQEEVAYAFDKSLDCDDGEEWKEVTAFTFIKRIVTILNAVAFVGRDLARNEEWQDLAYNYSNDLRRAFDALNRWHPWLRPFVHPFIFRHVGFSDRRRRAADLLQPLLAQSEEDASQFPTLMDFIRKRLGVRHSQDRALFARMQLRAALASSDTVAQALTNAVFDIASMPEHIGPLRKELHLVTSELPNGVWNISMLRSMSKMDSLLRESARVYAPFLVAMGRMTTSPLHLDDGTIVPKDTTVYFDMYHSHKSPEVQHGTDTTKYDGFRFSELRDKEELPNKYLAATTGPDNLPFGHGSHSCPGRFFAVSEMKVVLAHLLLNYDFKISQGARPETRHWGIAVIMDRNVKMLVRRRTPAFM
ncbi:alpha-ketoglutarate dependent xanthine dioxygenase [Colletotrichum sojae]|uniref:Alpha-ketoglutarate dependent xanthine dioxygenase n=1 Tax=Colletotrichum sojae TaxID=2175907 RepID=A0A8H6JBT0_9PEZI|nr:alpha-ketoglutarate dependent xanthine dioxygenase [Colletotrichum sojae]